LEKLRHTALMNKSINLEGYNLEILMSTDEVTNVFSIQVKLLFVHFVSFVGDLLLSVRISVSV
jgi:hypothetical protein